MFGWYNDVKTTTDQASSIWREINFLAEAYKVMFCTEEIDCNLGSDFVEGRQTVMCLLQVTSVFQLRVEVWYLVKAS
jgi:hypothetical protein